ncbi:MAG: response regulator transcription factor [Opitutaceae bacterium]|nr:response regulator transcription factor [Opitutaceae bacterium]
MSRQKNVDALDILVVDDQPVVLEGLAAMLVEQPDIVVAGRASCGEKALGVWEDMRPDAVILDLQMGRMHGMHVLKRIIEKDARASERKGTALFWASTGSEGTPHCVRNPAIRVARL